MASNTQSLRVNITGDAQKLNSTLEGVQGKMKRWGQTISRTGGMLTKFVSGPIAGAVGGLAMLAKKEGERADALLDAQAATQASTDTLQEYQHVAGQAGVAETFFADAAKDMSRQLASARQGTGRAADAFDELGVSIHDNEGNLRSTGELTEEAMDKLAGMDDEARRAAIAQDLFKSSQQDVLAVVSQGSDAIERQREEAHELGAVQSNEALQGANEFRQGLEKLSTRFSGLVSTIGGKFAPVLNDQVLPLVEEKVLPMLEGFADKLAGLVEWFTDLPAPVQGTIAAVAGLVAALGPLLIGVGTVISLMGSAVPAITGVIAVVKALGVAMMFLAANPVGLVITAIAAAIAIGIALYKNWDTVTEKVSQALSWLGDRFTAVKNWVIEQIVRIIAKGIELHEWFRALPGRVWTALQEFAGPVFDFIVEYHPVAILLRKAAELWPSVRSWFAELPGRIVSAIGDLGSLLVDKGKDVVSGLWEGIKSMGSWLFDKIAGWAKDMIPGPIADALNIGSPSRVTEDQGKAVAEGLAEGIFSQLGRVQKVSEQLAAAGTPQPGTGQAGLAGGEMVRVLRRIEDRLGQGGDTKIVVNNPQPAAAEEDVIRASRRRQMMGAG